MTGGETDTIFAPGTAPGLAAIAIVRISGPRAHEVLHALAGDADLPARELCLRTLRRADGSILDHALVAIFAERSSFTGEPMAEIQCHGGPAVLSGLLRELSGHPGCRLASPGEFTKRAVLGGIIGLTEAEGIGDLISAETELQQDAALKMLGGQAARKMETWRTALIRARALLEVTIDWSDEEVPEDVWPEVDRILEDLQGEVDAELSLADGAERLRTGVEVAIVGPPNVGKSTLLNAIAGREAALVSDVAGTTRDVLEVRYDLDGLLVTFLDTAGLRQTEDALEARGIALAETRARDADLRIFLQSADCPLEDDPGGLWRSGDLRVWSKSDLGTGAGDASISMMDRESVAGLLALIRTRLDDRVSTDGILGVERRRRLAMSVRDELVTARGLSGAEDIEIAAECLRRATTALDRLAGRLDVEDVLDQVFSTFCLGK